MHRFIKLSCDITKSTIWTEDDATFRIWIYLMAEADRDGVVYATIPGIALACSKTIEQVEAAFAKFEGPDPYSSNPAHAGRRIQKVDRGWKLLNYETHRDRKAGDPDWQKERNKRKVAAFRERQKAKRDVTGNRPVTGHCNPNPVTVTTEAEVEVEAELPIDPGKGSSISKPNILEEPTVARQEPSVAKLDPLEAIYQAYPRLVGKRKALEAISKAVERLTIGPERRNDAPFTKREAQKWLYVMVKRYAESAAGQRGTLTPHPATWFNQSRYLDNPAEWERAEEAQSYGKKQSVMPDNIAAANRFIERISGNGRTATAGGDHSQVNDGAVGLLRASGDGAGDSGLLFGAGRPDSGTGGDRIQPSGQGVQVLAGASRPQGTGGRRALAPPF